MLEVFAQRLFNHIDTLVSFGRSATRFLLGYRPNGDRFVSFQSRVWATDIAFSRQFLSGVQRGKWDGRINWRGIPNVKDPYDLALVPLLLWELKPRTIIELGSYMGGSALWMADLMDAMGIHGRIYSFDIDTQRIKAKHPKVEFHQADCFQPSTLTVPGLAELPRPWLVIEDSHANTFAVLSHFHPHLKSGDYLIVEDTAFVLRAYRALERFIAEHPDAYQVDRRYTDLFGYNATFNFNGYLKRV